MDDSDPRTLVLLVEDDANAARMLAQLLREDGFDVEILADGEAALKRLERAPAPRVLILDYRLPGVDGLTIARRARSLVPQAQVLMVTSYPELVGAQLRAANADAVLVSKPLAYEELTRHLAATRTNRSS